MRVADYIFQFIANKGVRHVFVLSGGGAMHLVDALGRNRDLEFVCVLHEQAAAIAADAYSQYTEKTGVALVTTGPGGTNAITGVAASWIDSIPTLILSGQVKRADLKTERRVRQMGNQEIGIIGLVSSITKYAITVMEPEKIRYHLEKAWHLAHTGRPGPVWLDIPLDVQAAQVEEQTLTPFTPQETERQTGTADLEAAVAKALSLYEAAKRPAILVGNGVRLAQAKTEFYALLASMPVPVLTTWKTVDFLPEEHPLYCGRPGMIGQRGANILQQKADWLLVLGSRLDLVQTGFNHPNFAPRAQKVIVDVDATEIGKLNMPLAVPVVADAGTFLRQWLQQCRSRPMPPRESWIRECKDLYRRFPLCLPEYWQESEYVNTYVLIDVLSDSLGSEDILIPGSSGAAAEIPLQSFRTKQGQRVISCPGLGAMGFGLPHTLGACLAGGGRRTICVNGDGGIQLNIQEFTTLQRLGLPIKIFVLNNGGYASIRSTQRNYFDGFYVASGESSGLHLPDILRIADAYGLYGVRIEHHGHIREKVEEVLQHPGPVVCEVMTHPEQPTLPRLISKKKADGTLVTSPMEDMWPFLEPDELKRIMDDEAAKSPGSAGVPPAKAMEST